MTVFEKAETDTTNILVDAMNRWHPNLFDAGVSIGVIMAYNESGAAVKDGGYPCLGKIKVVSSKDRIPKGYDAELLIDEREYLDLTDAQRLAMFDHYLCHLDLVPLSVKELGIARSNDSQAPWWKLDDKGRPRLKLIKGDWNTGDAFAACIGRHQASAIEYVNISKAKGLADKARADGERNAAEREAMATNRNGQHEGAKA